MKREEKKTLVVQSRKSSSSLLPKLYSKVKIFNLRIKLRLIYSTKESNPTKICFPQNPENPQHKVT